ncbi:hypothetical protein [Burkholderia sp. Bp9143]|uniref:hypothetical protein n=1 Tax=Burkholderia sp. Bp9143 TaxID=2184574 RepID=UPI001627B3C0|nr:hypothetical protein [Burkholderia sp. Bp9143]
MKFINNVSPRGIDAMEHSLSGQATVREAAIIEQTWRLFPLSIVLRNNQALFI